MSIFLHSADWHIGKPYNRINDDTKRVIAQQARLDTVAAIGQLAREHGAAFVLAAGDLLDSPSADRNTVSAFCDAVGKISVPVFAIPGNHDNAAPGSVWHQDYFKREQAALAPNLHMLLESVPVETDAAVILPCPLLRRATTADPTFAWRSTEAFKTFSPDKPRILLAHGSVQNFSATDDIGEDEDATSALRDLDLDRLPSGEIDYIALGDWHGTKQVANNAWYSGTPETDRFPKGEDNSPGNVLLVESTRTHAPKVTPLATSKLHWHEHTFIFGADNSLAVLEASLDELLGGRTRADFLLLSLGGSLGLATRDKLDETLRRCEARLIRLKLRDAVTLAPTPAEEAALAQQTANPLLAKVAARLLDESRGTGESAEIAKLALRELHAAMNTSTAS